MRIPSFRFPRNRRGVTLVELMIVVAIIGILAGIASIAYKRYVTGAKISEMKSIALEVAGGQERYRARNNRYLSPGGPYSDVGAAPRFQNLLDFSRRVNPDIVVETVGWEAGGACAVCATHSIPVNLGSAGFAVVITRDFNSADAADTVVYVTNDMDSPVILNEGG